MRPVAVWCESRVMNALLGRSHSSKGISGGLPLTSRGIRLTVVIVRNIEILNLGRSLSMWSGTSGRTPRPIVRGCKDFGTKNDEVRGVERWVHSDFSGHS